MLNLLICRLICSFCDKSGIFLPVMLTVGTECLPMFSFCLNCKDGLLSEYLGIAAFQNAYGCEFFGNRAEKYSGTVVNTAVTVQKKVRNRTG